MGNMVDVLQKILVSLKPGGVLLFRDYGIYDMTQMRFVAKKRRKIDESFYVRADGTRTYFFRLEVLQNLFTQAGFEIERLKYDTRELKNRKRMLTMYRVWVTAKLRRPDGASPNSVPVSITPASPQEDEGVEDSTLVTPSTVSTIESTE